MPHRTMKFVVVLRLIACSRPTFRRSLRAGRWGRCLRLFMVPPRVPVSFTRWGWLRVPHWILLVFQTCRGRRGRRVVTLFSPRFKISIVLLTARLVRLTVVLFSLITARQKCFIISRANWRRGTQRLSRLARFRRRVFTRWHTFNTLSQHRTPSVRVGPGRGAFSRVW